MSYSRKARLVVRISGLLFVVAIFAAWVALGITKAIRDAKIPDKAVIDRQYMEKMESQLKTEEAENEKLFGSIHEWLDQMKARDEARKAPEKKDD